MSDRYDVSGSIEAQFEPGSDGQVLRNRLGIVDPGQLEDLEFDRLFTLEEQLIDELLIDQQIMVNDLREWHFRWLGEIYEWAGRYRTVALSKDNFPFATPGRIPALMATYEKRYLSTLTPCVGMTRAQIVDALSVCHVELILIHPFRDGNGRVARLLAMIMAIQAGFPPLDFQSLVDNKAAYVEAIHAGVSKDYDPMRNCFDGVIRDSLRMGFEKGE